jgi:exonuclease III
VTYLVQINGLNRDKGPGVPPRWTKSGFVSDKSEKTWKIDIGKSTTITTTITDAQKFKRKKYNILKWLKSLEKVINRQIETFFVGKEDDFNRSRSSVREEHEDREGREDRLGTGTRRILRKGSQIRFLFNIAERIFKIYSTQNRLRFWILDRICYPLTPPDPPNLKVIKECDETRTIEKCRKPGEVTNGESDEEGDLNDLNGESDSVLNSLKCFFLSTARMIALTIRLMLLQQTVERNPGPENNSQEFKIVTYNTNGLGDKNKLRRILRKSEPIVNKGGLVLLQETHIVNSNDLKLLWKNKFQSNCSSTNSAGLLILYNNEYELVEEYSDKVGRQLIVAIKSGEKKYIVGNAYYPNDHKQSLTFSNEMYENILKFQQNYPDFDTIFGGDFNLCMTKNDGLNRNRTKMEETLSNLIQENNKVIEVSDAYRHVNSRDGYTWKRGMCYSRLDYIFVSANLVQRIVNVNVDWAWETSDHAALIINMKEESLIPRGPGLAKINVKIIEDPIIALQIESEITEMMSQANNNWNPHTKLEFLKVCIRSVFSTKVMEMRKILNNDILNTEEELNQIEELTRTAWAVFKYCGTKTAPLRMKI